MADETMNYPPCTVHGVLYGPILIRLIRLSLPPRYVLHNPFTNRRLDVAHETIGNGIRRLSVAIAKGAGYLPPVPLAMRKGGQVDGGEAKT